MADKKSALIYIVDDDEFLRKVHHKKLEQVGFEVKSVKNGEEGLELLKTKKPDLLLLDLVMPKMNGFDVLQKIKEYPKIQGMPVVVFSSLGQKSDIEKAKELGATEYMIKSTLDLDHLVNKVKNLLFSSEE